MVSPTQNTGSPQNILHTIDRRAESIISQALVNHEFPIYPETFAKIRHIQEIHPETKAALDELLQQFGSLTLNTREESIPINRLLARETSPVLKVITDKHFEDPTQSFNLSEFAPVTIRLLIELLENKKVEPSELLIHAPELLALGDELQIEHVTHALVTTRNDYIRLTPDDYRALLDQALTHKNFIVYFSLLYHAGANDQCKGRLSPEELEITNHIKFENISDGRQITIRLNAVEAISLYAKMRAVESAPSGGVFTASIHPPKGKTVSFLKEIKKTFDTIGWPNKVHCTSICIPNALTDFFTNPQKTENLTALEFASCTIGDQLVQLLPKGLQLKELIIKGCHLTNHSAQPLARYLSSFTTLKTLSLENSGLNTIGIAFIIDALKHHPNLSTLNLSENHLDAKVIPGSVATLILSKNPLGDSGAHLLASVLSQPHAIEHLDLSNCQIHNDGVGAICRAICDNPLLYSLHLNSNPFTSEATAPLCELLAMGVTLTHLDLSNCLLTAADLSAIAESLRHNKQLSRLTLAGTDVTDDVAAVFANVLRENQTLSSLSLRSTKITDTGAKLLLEAIQHKTQFELSLAFNALSDDCKTELRQNPHVLLG